MTAATRLRAASAAAAAAAAAKRTGRTQWAGVRVRAAATDCLAIFAPHVGERFYWEQPDRGFAIAARGAAHLIEAAGPERFRIAAEAARECFASLHLAGDDGPQRSGAVLVGGFAFSETPSESRLWRGFPPCRFALPEVLYSRTGSDAWLTVVRRIAPDTDPEGEAAALNELLAGLPEATQRASRPTAEAATVLAAGGTAPCEVHSALPEAQYLERVEAALCAIGVGDLEKVVLARSLALRRETPIEVGGLLQRLRTRYPRCTSFAVGHADGTFVGATPEHLVRLSAGRVETAAVAGSAPREHDPDEDERLGRALCESKKEQSEHAVVVRALREALTDVCEPLEVPEAPRLLRLDEIQHLETRITGTLRNGSMILDLVERMHPTPAVGGAPRAAALHWIEAHEGLDRGWYAGPVGFIDAEGGGEFCVALRSALTRGCEAQLFAGAGIVDGSRPEAELQETRLKLRAMLAPLQEIGL